MAQPLVAANPKYLLQLLAEKDRIIAGLRSQLTAANLTIASLRSGVRKSGSAGPSTQRALVGPAFETENLASDDEEEEEEEEEQRGPVTSSGAKLTSTSPYTHSFSSSELSGHPSPVPMSFATAEYQSSASVISINNKRKHQSSTPIKGFSTSESPSSSVSTEDFSAVAAQPIVYKKPRRRVIISSSPSPTSEEQQGTNIRENLTRMHDVILSAIMFGNLAEYAESLRESYSLCQALDLRNVCAGFLGCGGYGCAFDSTITTDNGAPLIIKVAFQGESIDDQTSEAFIEIATGLMLQREMGLNHIPPFFTRMYYVAACRGSELAMDCAPAFLNYMNKGIASKVEHFTDYHFTILRQHMDVDPRIITHVADADDAVMHQFIIDLYQNLLVGYNNAVDPIPVRPAIQTKMGGILLKRVRSAVLEFYDQTQHHAYLLTSKGSASLQRGINRSDFSAYMSMLLMIASGLIAASEWISFVHHDLHVGNVMVQDLPTETNYTHALIRLDSRVVRVKLEKHIPLIIDFGMSTWVSPNTQREWSTESLNPSKRRSEETFGPRQNGCPAMDFLKLLKSVADHAPPKQQQNSQTLSFLILSLSNALRVTAYTDVGTPFTKVKMTNTEFEEIILQFLSDAKMPLPEYSFEAILELKNNDWVDQEGRKFLNLIYSTATSS